MYDDIILEDFGIIPIGLNEVEKIGPDKVYTSQKLRDQYISAISNQRVMKPVIARIKELVNSNIIVPCFASSGVFNFLKHKLTAEEAEKGLMGFFSLETNKIYILMDNRTEFLIWMNNQNLSLVTIHELMHYACVNKKREFFNIFKSELTKYYGAFYENFADITIPTKTLELIVAYMLTHFEWEKDIKLFNNIIKYSEFLYKHIEGSTSQKNLAITTPLSLIKIYFFNPNAYISMLQRNEGEARNLYYALLNSYSEIGIKHPDTMPIQEITFASEVIAISSERPKLQHYKAINSI